MQVIWEVVLGTRAGERLGRVSWVVDLEERRSEVGELRQGHRGGDSHNYKLPLDAAAWAFQEE